MLLNSNWPASPRLKLITHAFSWQDAVPRSECAIRVVPAVPDPHWRFVHINALLGTHTLTRFVGCFAFIASCRLSS
jgi:hypothetical protein